MPPNVFFDLPSQLPNELVETLAAAGTTRVERIVSLGHVSPDDHWYDQDQDEFVLLLRGSARLRFDTADAGPLDLRPGDYVVIPAHRKHRVEWTAPDEPTVWLCVFYG